MDRRWALFVDAGWVFAAGSTAAFGERLPRIEIGWDPATMIDALVGHAAGLVAGSAELLRVYWYDGSPNRLPIGDQIRVAELPDVKLRLGRTARDGQKGVDGLIIHDLITLSFRGMIADAVVITGDEDLLEAIEAAQANGTRVHLLEIPIGGISPSMLRAPDRTGRLDDRFWSDHIARLTITPAAAPVTPPTVLSRPLPGGPTVRPAWLDAPLPTPLPPPAGATDIEPVDYVTIGARMAEEWTATASGDEHAELIAARPYLPRDLDARLLRAAGRWLENDERRELRDAFWTTVVAVIPNPTT